MNMLMKPLATGAAVLLSTAAAQADEEGRSHEHDAGEEHHQCDGGHHSTELVRRQDAADQNDHEDPRRSARSGEDAFARHVPTSSADASCWARCS